MKKKSRSRKCKIENILALYPSIHSKPICDDALNSNAEFLSSEKVTTNSVLVNGHSSSLNQADTNLINSAAEDSKVVDTGDDNSNLNSSIASPSSASLTNFSGSYYRTLTSRKNKSGFRKSLAENKIIIKKTFGKKFETVKKFLNGSINYDDVESTNNCSQYDKGRMREDVITNLYDQDTSSLSSSHDTGNYQPENHLKRKNKSVFDGSAHDSSVECHDNFPKFPDPVCLEDNSLLNLDHRTLKKKKSHKSKKNSSQRLATLDSVNESSSTLATDLSIQGPLLMLDTEIVLPRKKSNKNKKLDTVLQSELETINSGIERIIISDPDSKSPRKQGPSSTLPLVFKLTSPKKKANWPSSPSVRSSPRKKLAESVTTNSISVIASPKLKHRLDSAKMLVSEQTEVTAGKTLANKALINRKYVDEASQANFGCPHCTHCRSGIVPMTFDIGIQADSLLGVIDTQEVENTQLSEKRLKMDTSVESPIRRTTRSNTRLSTRSMAGRSDESSSPCKSISGSHVDSVDNDPQRSKRKHDKTGAKTVSSDSDSASASTAARWIALPQRSCMLDGTGLTQIPDIIKLAYDSHFNEADMATVSASKLSCASDVTGWDIPKRSSSLLSYRFPTPSTQDYGEKLSNLSDDEGKATSERLMSDVLLVATASQQTVPSSKPPQARASGEYLAAFEQFLNRKSSSAPDPETSEDEVTAMDDGIANDKSADTSSIQRSSQFQSATDDIPTSSLRVNIKNTRNAVSPRRKQDHTTTTISDRLTRTQQKMVLSSPKRSNLECKVLVTPLPKEKAKREEYFKKKCQSAAAKNCIQNLSELFKVHQADEDRQDPDQGDVIQEDVVREELKNKTSNHKSKNRDTPLNLRRKLRSHNRAASRCSSTSSIQNLDTVNLTSARSLVAHKLQDISENIARDKARSFRRDSSMEIVSDAGGAAAAVNDTGDSDTETDLDVYKANSRTRARVNKEISIVCPSESDTEANFDYEPLPESGKNYKSRVTSGKRKYELDHRPSSGCSTPTSKTSSRPCDSLMPPKKKYQKAGLFSNSYKDDNKKVSSDLEMSSGKTEEQDVVKMPLMPTPVHIGKKLWLETSDFELPFNLYWLKTHNMLQLPSPRYKKIRNNVYVDAKPTCKDYEPHQCSCTLPRNPREKGCGDSCLNRIIYTECNPATCPCSDRCDNQRIQKHMWAPGLEKFQTQDRGYGVRCSKPIQSGQYISEYLGEVVSEQEFRRRMSNEYSQERHHYCLNLNGVMVIDGYRMGNICRLVNHSCQPNCEMQKWNVNGVYRIALFALEDISPNTELTYDYNFHSYNLDSQQTCKCGSENCRQVVGGRAQKTNGQVKEKNDKDSCREFVIENRVKLDKSISPVKPLTSRERIFIRKHYLFLLRNLEKGKENRRDLLLKEKEELQKESFKKADVFMAQFTAINTSRSVRTRQLTIAEEDADLTKTADLAQILKQIFTNVSNCKDQEDNLLAESLLHLPSRKKVPDYYQLVKDPMDVATVERNINSGRYHASKTFHEDFLKIFANAEAYFGSTPEIIKLRDEYFSSMRMASSFLESIGDTAPVIAGGSEADCNESTTLSGIPPNLEKHDLPPQYGDEDVIRCVCNIFRDEGVMIQCEKCEKWQHQDCVGVNNDNEPYMCELCDPRPINKEIPLDVQPDDGEKGCLYHMTLMRDDTLQLHVGEAIYVTQNERDTMYRTKALERPDKLDIFRIERLWITRKGEKMMYGFYYFRPQETFHEANRKFFKCEIFRVPLYEILSVRYALGSCCIMDLPTYCLGRPKGVKERDVYICEYRVNKAANQFKKLTKVKYSISCQSFCFDRFPEKLHPKRTFTPHEIPSGIKSRSTNSVSEDGTTQPVDSPAINSPAIESPAVMNLSEASQDHRRVPNKASKCVDVKPVKNKKGIPHDEDLPLSEMKKEKIKQKQERLHNIIAKIILENECLQSP